jgi:hypothetical protein
MDRRPPLQFADRCAVRAAEWYQKPFAAVGAASFNDPAPSRDWAQRGQNADG